MSRAAATSSGGGGTPLSSLPFAQLQAILNSENEGITDRSPKEWFERALRESELAILAERKQRKEEMFLCYTKACHYYVNAKMHPDFASVKRGDANWATRVKDFKETYEAYLNKAKELKEVLRRRDVERDGSPASPPTPTSKNSGPETGSMGSIADRMKALSGKGMDVGGPTKRMSKDVSPTTPTAPVASSSRIQATGGAGNYGPARTPTGGGGGGGGGGGAGASRPRAGSQASQAAETRSRSSSVKEAKPPAAAEEHHQRHHLPHPPAVAPKPKLPTPPTPTPAPAPAIHQSDTGSSTSSTRANVGDPLQPTSAPTSANHTGPPKPTSSKPPLPPIPQQQQPQRTRGASESAAAGGMDDFERTFPSLDDFGKQFPEDEPPEEEKGGMSNGQHYAPDGEDEDEDGDRTITFPDVPSFPDLPSVPSSRPGGANLPPPPSGSPPTRFEDLKSATSGNGGGGHDSPPNPDVDRDVKRPSSQPNLTNKLDGRVGPASHQDLPDLKDKDYSEPLAMSPQSTQNGHHYASPPPPAQAAQAPISFPKPQPAPAKKDSGVRSMKPKFPFSNSVTPETLRSYFLNPEVELVLLDVRPEDEVSKGYVGAEYEGRGGPIRNVWMDPTVLLRNDITSTKLEDSLSLSPEAQRKAFEDRHKFDLVVVYDSRSEAWPRKGSAPSPLSRLWDAIYEHEFSKRLDRTPVLLEGGYAAWREFIKMRVAHNISANANAAQANGHSHGQGQGHPPPRSSSKQVNGYGPSPATSPRPPERGASGESSKRANREMPVYQASPYARNVADNLGYSHAQSMATSSSHSHLVPSRSYVTSPPTAGHRASHSTSSHYNSPSTIAPPPQASIHPGPGVRRQSDYVEHHNQAYSGYMSPNSTSSSRQPKSIDYPTPHGLALSHPQPPPPTAAHSLERYDARPAVPRSTSIRGLDLVANGDEIRYWNDVMLGLTGLKNFGSTCYMNSTIQCLSATYPFSQYFLDGSFKRAINYHNKLGTQGNLANAWSELLKALWREDYTFLSPVTFRTSIVRFASQFSATNEQHDSQEFLSFVLDGLHEDLNRVQKPPPPVEMTPEREAALETLPPEVAAEKEWQIYKQRNDSFIVDLFQGQYRNRLECLTCHKTSTTYDTFMYISLPITTGKNKVVVQELIDDFIASEIMDGDDKWNCPRCKVPRRATKTLTIARLPPIVIIQLKRFTTKNGVFWDKSENHVIFPIRGLDLTRYVPHRQQRGNEDMDDPRTQIGPFKYDLFGVSNHIGTLSSGHYTAFVKSAKGWTFAEDSRISRAQEKDIVSRQAYMLFYKRVR